MPLNQRTQLVVRLLDSISMEERSDSNPQQIQKAWLEEANRRYEAYLRGEEDAMPAEEFFAQLRAEDR